MANLLDVSEARALLRTSKSDDELEEIIAREESEMIRRFGAHWATGITVQETHKGKGYNLFLRRPTTAITSITEDDVAVASADYRLWGGEGRVERISGYWAGVCVVTFTPANDNPGRKRALIQLVRLELERTAMKTESIGGEYSYTAPDWDKERSRVYRRAGFVLV